MKKLTAILLALGMLFACTACGKTEAPAPAPADTPSAPEEPAVSGGDLIAEIAIPVMTHAEFDAAEMDTMVCVETAVQAKQGWWEDNGQGVASIYTQGEDGAYFLYNMPMTENRYNELVPGTKIKVAGFKSEWSGEVEITDGVFEIQDGTYTAQATDVTGMLASEELIKHQNEFVSFTGMTVEEEALYKWDGSGAEGDDLYFKVSSNGNTYSFTVESYLCGKETEVYQAVKNLKVGDTVDLEGFLYWYEGANPHITKVTVK